MSIYVTGDTHGGFGRIVTFCSQYNTTEEDILIILGDAGINYMGEGDYCLKKKLRELPITLFCIHGNHERRPESLPCYHLESWHGGMVYLEDGYPNILFARDGEVYDFDGQKAIVIGGAYSVDKEIRILRNWGWWADEQPSEETKKYVEQQLEQTNWKVDLVLTHTVPLKYEPVEVFLPGIDQRGVDKSTEEWLDSIEEKLTYKKWYCGHYHTEKSVDRVEIFFENYDKIMKK